MPSEVFLFNFHYCPVKVDSSVIMVKIIKDYSSALFKNQNLFCRRFALFDYYLQQSRIIVF